MKHDVLCPVVKSGGNCCSWMPFCECQCLCDIIYEVRHDTLQRVQKAIEDTMQWPKNWDRTLGATDALNAVASLQEKI